MLLWRAVALYYYHQNSLLVQFPAFQRTSGFTEILFDLGCVWCQNLFGKDSLHLLFMLNFGWGWDPFRREEKLVWAPSILALLPLSSWAPAKAAGQSKGPVWIYSSMGGQGCRWQRWPGRFLKRSKSILPWGLSGGGGSTLPPSEKASLWRGHWGCCFCRVSLLILASFWHWCSSTELHWGSAVAKSPVGKDG